MSADRKAYIWFYDNIHSRYYDILMKWCYLPLGGERRSRDEMISDIDFSENEMILDMCCGTGGATFPIARRVHRTSRIIGMDLSRGQIRRAKKKNGYDNVEFIQGDVQRTGYPDENFNKVFITHSLHEMSRDTRLKVLAEAGRIMKTGGELFILELDRPDSFLIRFLTGLWFFYWLPFNFETPTRRDMIKHGLVNEVRISGFKDIEKISKTRGLLQVVTAKKRSL
jgi:demethylmenaquinone methyltransferase/2-methoxy-6-polyprenyl-1,4-benzoquinol methylase